MPASRHLNLPPILANAPATLGGFLAEVAAEFGDCEALVHYDALRGGARASWSYAELLSQSRKVAKALMAAGLGKGERVGLLLGNRNEFAAGLFGTAMVGGLPVTLSTFSTRDELRVLLAAPAIAGDGEERYAEAGGHDGDQAPILRRKEFGGCVEHAGGVV